jgi:hypothetical protein
VTRALAAIAAAVVAAVAGCGDADIVIRDPPRPAVEPRTAIAGVRLGMPGAEVTRRLGPADAERTSDLHGGWTQRVYRDEGLRVTLDERRTVWDVRTAHPGHRTAADAGVGSTREALLEAHPALTCRPAGAGGRGPAVAGVDASQLEGPFTQFALADGRRVTRVTVARGLAL